MEKIFNQLNELVAQKIIISIIIWALIILIKKTILFVMHSKIEDVRKYYNYKKLLNYILFIFGFFILLSIWIDQVSSFSTFVGIITAALAISLKELLSNIAGWIFIILRKPFEVGDRIEINGYSGDVIDIRLFQFTINEIGNWVDGDQSTGRVIHIPNFKAFTLPIANYTKGFKYIWNEIPILITFESDWEKAKTIFEDIAQRNCEHINKEAEEKLKNASKNYMIFYNKLTPIVYVSVKDSGILLTIRYLCDPRKKRITIDLIWQDVLRELEKHDQINLAYKTERIVIR